MVGIFAVLISLHDLSLLPKITGETETGGFVDPLERFFSSTVFLTDR